MHYRADTDNRSDYRCITKQVIIQKRLHNQLLKELHKGHVGVCRMKALARSFVWWPGLDQDIEVVAARCDKCKVTASMPATVPWNPWQHPSSPWDRTHVDFGEWNQKYFLVVVDAFSKWPEVRHMPSSTTAERTIEDLEDVFATHEFPRLLVSGNVPQFTAMEFENFLKRN